MKIGRTLALVAALIVAAPAFAQPTLADSEFTADDNNTTVTCDVPGVVTSGQLGVIVTTSATGGAVGTTTLTTPATGWSQLATFGETFRARINVFTRTMDGTEDGGTVVFTASASTDYTCAFFLFSSHNGTGAYDIDDTFLDDASSTHACPNITTTAANSIVVCHLLENRAVSANTATQPTGWTEVAESGTGPPLGNGFTASGAYDDFASTGAIGSHSWGSTNATGPSHTLSVEILAAASGSVAPPASQYYRRRRN
jgi:hypothetical protein